IADGQPQDAVIATGLPVTILASDLVSKQGIRPDGLRDLTTWHATVRATKLQPQSIHLGRLLLSGVPLGTYDLAGALSLRGIKDPPKIWLGASALAAVVVTIDPQRHLVVLQPPNTE